MLLLAVLHCPSGAVDYLIGLIGGSIVNDYHFCWAQCLIEYALKSLN
jgi:CBS-domain-containing membrane protein